MFPNTCPNLDFACVQFKHYLITSRAGCKKQSGEEWFCIIQKNSSLNTYFLCVHAKLLQSCLTLYNPMDYSPPGFSVHGIFHGKNTGVGCHALQGIFPTQGPNLLLLLLHCRQILYDLNCPQESPMYLLTTNQIMLCNMQDRRPTKCSMHFTHCYL